MTERIASVFTDKKGGVGGSESEFSIETEARDDETSCESGEWDEDGNERRSL
jgi:hypothetical protein